MNNIKHITLSKLTLCLLFIILIWVNFIIANWKKKDRVIEWDVKSYYAYLPAAFIYHDITLSFRNDKPEYLEWFWARPAPNGSLVILTSMGMSILYSPFFFIAHFYTSLFSPEDATGYSPPYSFMLVMSTIFYTMIGLLYLRKLLLFFFKDIIVSLLLIAIFLGTNLFCYSTTHSVLSHAYSFSIIAVFLYNTIRWHNNPSFKRSILLGITSGLASLIRPTNIIIIVLFLFWDCKNFKDVTEKAKLFYSNRGKILTLLFFAFLIWVPQLIYWKYLTGQWLYYSYGSEQRFFFNNPHIFNVLFSFRNGWFIYSPIMLVAVLGLIIMALEFRKGYFLPVMLYFALNVYLVSSWWCWWYGGSFGARSFIDSYAVYALPLGFVFQKSFSLKKIYRIILLTFFALLIILCQFLTYKYRYGSIHYDSMTSKAFFNSFWNLKPKPTFYEKLKKPDYEKALYGIYETAE